MAAVAPRHVGQVGGGVLLLAADGGVRLAKVVEAKAVKGVGVGVEGIIKADGVSGDADLSVGGNDESVGEAEVFADEAFVRDCAELSGYHFGGGGDVHTEHDRIEALTFAHKAVQL